MRMQLVLPTSKYKKSFLQALDEYLKEESLPSTQDLFLLDKKVLEKEFSTYVTKLVDESLGKNLPVGYVSHTVYWLIDSYEFIGRVDIRHSLTEHLMRIGGHIGYDIRPSKRQQGYGKEILKLVMPKAKALGLKKVLVTCDETNIASKKIIEANGGVFENSVKQAIGKPNKLRYWINLP